MHLVPWHIAETGWNTSPGLSKECAKEASKDRGKVHVATKHLGGKVQLTCERPALLRSLMICVSKDVSGSQNSGEWSGPWHSHLVHSSQLVRYVFQGELVALERLLSKAEQFLAPGGAKGQKLGVFGNSPFSTFFPGLDYIYIILTCTLIYIDMDCYYHTCSHKQEYTILSMYMMHQLYPSMLARQSGNMLAANGFVRSHGNHHLPLLGG